MEIIESFNQAVADSKTLAQKPNNQILLKLYSLYKQATHGDIDVPEPSSPFDFVAKAKHSAWQDLKGMQKEAAMQQYVDLVASLRGKA